MGTPHRNVIVMATSECLAPALGKPQGGAERDGESSSWLKSGESHCTASLEARSERQKMVQAFGPVPLMNTQHLCLSIHFFPPGK